MPAEYQILRHPCFYLRMVFYFIYVHPATFAQFFLQCVHPSVPVKAPFAILLYSACQGRLLRFQGLPPLAGLCRLSLFRDVLHTYLMSYRGFLKKVASSATLPESVMRPWAWLTK